jgi:hypothetical protein
MRDFDAAHPTNDDKLMRANCVAAEILINFLDPDWVFAHVYDGKRTATGRPVSNILKPNALSDEDRFKNQDRVIALADMLFNLQDINGFDLKLKRLRTEDLESLVAEFEVAALLAKSNIAIQFVEESSTIGADYDIAATIGGIAVACEAKCKIETTPMSAGGITSTLEKARKQLPLSGPGIVFIKLPEAWVRDPEIDLAMADATPPNYTVSGRISTIIFYWEEWDKVPSGGRVRRTAFRPYHNPDARVPLKDLGNIITISADSAWIWLLPMIAA